MGGLAGHMMHPHDDLSLTFGDFLKLFEQTVDNKLEMSEKLDGFNIHILNKEGQIRFARNAGDLETGGFGKDEIENRFSNDRVREVFRKGFELAEQDDRFKKIPDWDLFHNTMNVEIIIGRTNIMPYDQEILIPHNLYRWGPWKPEGKETYKFRVLAIDDLPGAYKPRIPLLLDFPERDQNPCYWAESVQSLIMEADLWFNDTIEDYYRVKFARVVMAIMKGTFSHELVTAMFNRFFGIGEKINLRELRKEHGSENVQKFLDLEKQLVFLTKDDLDQLVLSMGTYILEHTYGVNRKTDTTYEAINTLYKEVLAIVRKNPEQHKVFLHRWKACDGKVFDVEGLVVKFNHKLYKWTGPFAPINQLLGGNR